MRKLLRLLAVPTFAVAVWTGVFAAQTAGTPAAPTANPLFQDRRVVPVSISFTAAEYAALAPRRAPRGGSDESWLQGAEGKRNGLSASRGIEFPFAHGDVVIDGRAVKNVGIRYKGNGTFMLGQQVGKVSLKLDFNQFVKGQKLGPFKTLNLHSNVTDASYMNEVLAFRLFRAAGIPAPRTAYAEVRLTVPGKFNNTLYGVFSLVENPDEPFMVARGLPETGAIFKPVTHSLFADLGRDWARYNQTYDPKTPLTPAQRQRVIDFSSIVSRGSDTQFATAAAEFLDLDNVARYMAVTVWLSDMDGILGSGQNYYLYLDPRSNRFSFMAWDQDHSFGQFFRGSQRDREQLDILRPFDGDNRFLDRLYRLPAFKTRYLAAMRELTRTVLNADQIAAQVDTLAVLLRPAVGAESAERLNRLETAVAGRRPRVDDGMFAGANVPIKPFAKARAAAVAQQLATIR